MIDTVRNLSADESMQMYVWAMSIHIKCGWFIFAEKKEENLIYFSQHITAKVCKGERQKTKEFSTHSALPWQPDKKR